MIEEKIKLSEQIVEKKPDFTLSIKLHRALAKRRSRTLREDALSPTRLSRLRARSVSGPYIRRNPVPKMREGYEVGSVRHYYITGMRQT